MVLVSLLLSTYSVLARLLHHLIESTLNTHGCFPGGLVVRNLPANAGDTGSIPGSRRSPGAENSNPIQCSCLGNPTDRGAWWATVHRVAKTRTQLSDWAYTYTRDLNPEHVRNSYNPVIKRQITQVKNGERIQRKYINDQKHMKGCSYEWLLLLLFFSCPVVSDSLWPLGKCKSKLQWDITSHPLRWLS